MGFENLLKPIKISTLKIKNRIAMSPMNVTFSTQDGYATNQNIAWHARRAKGGFGLIITDAIIATKLAAPFVWGRNLYLYNDSYIAGLGQIVDAVHYYGAKIFAQLSIGFGRQGHAIDDSIPYAPSPIGLEFKVENLPKSMVKYYNSPHLLEEFEARYKVPREMTKEEIISEEEKYAKSCLRAVEAGFDGIEVHATHGYLEHQFLSKRSNKRTDEYGGSLENRMRFLTEAIEKALDTIKGVIPLGVRLSAAEHMSEGMTINEVKIVVKKLQDLGISFIDLSDGSYEALKYFFPENIEHVENHFLKEAKEIKDIIDIPLIVPSIHDPNLAERAISEGFIDIASQGRQAIADPDWANKVAEGRVQEITKCKRCLSCVVRTLMSLYPRCTVNPEVGCEERTMDLLPTVHKGPIINPKVAEWAFKT